MGLDNTYGELSGIFCGGLSYDGYPNHSSSSDYFRFTDPLPAVMPQMATESYSNPSSTVSRANTETDNPEDWEFISDESLNYISRMLLEEDIDEKVSMYQAESATLRAAAKPFYDILGHKFPPSPEHQSRPWSVDSPIESGGSSRTQSVADTVTSSSIGGAVDSNQRFDDGHREQLEAYGGLCGQSSQPLVGPSSDACSAEGVLEDPLITNGRIPEYLFESLPTWDFRRGIEEAQKFLPVMFDDLLTEKKATDLRELMRNEASKNSQAVAADDRRTANELLKQIRHHSKPNGDGTQRRLSKRKAVRRFLRITGIDVPQPGFRPTERIEETGQRLAEYAKKFGVPFEYQGIASKWETIRVEDLKVGKDEVVIVNCLYRFRNLIDETVAVDSPRNRVLNTIRQEVA
ncbi:hypothetical protein HU200_025808 [Digitaria exilis]|uniref:Uncharacterized protein n=1 Tax=Digitaria exilis TaxID=1010633 RepID=A0A835CA01_9POAL|nr:hypothetical protein HU200_025808 [Digitaria exilis]